MEQKNACWDQGIGLLYFHFPPLCIPMSELGIDGAMALVAETGIKEGM